MNLDDPPPTSQTIPITCLFLFEGNAEVEVNAADPEAAPGLLGIVPSAGVPGVLIKRG